MAVSSSNYSLNPNADPFLYHPPPIPIPIPIPIPLFNISHQFSQFVSNMKMHPSHSDQIPSELMGWSPMHGYVQYQFFMSGLYDVNMQTWCPFSAGFDGTMFQPPDVSAFGCREVKVGGDLSRIAKMSRTRWSEKKCKIEVKSEPLEKEMNVVVDDDDDAFLLSSISGDVINLETTTVMIRNIPNQFRRRDLLNILDKHCWLENGSQNHNSSSDSCLSQYDFVYLPMDFRRYWFDRKISNLGYAFVNFTSPIAASKFCKLYHRREWKVNVNKKVCEVNRAKIQGLKALKETFRNKIFWCHSNQYLPVTLEPPSDGLCSYKVISVGKRVAVVPPKPMKKCG